MRDLSAQRPTLRGPQNTSPSQAIRFLVVALLCATWPTSYCHADCLACWQLKGVTVHLKDGTTIKGYATWNDSWAALGYLRTKEGDQVSRALENKKEFPEVICDPAADIDGITVYTHLRSIKYPVKTLLVATREPISVNVKQIKGLKLNPGPHDGYHGACDLPVVSPRIADLLQTKPLASCKYDGGAGDMYWVSYDLSFPPEELRRLCEEHISDEEIRKSLKARDIISLYYAYD